jgi:threonine/homoserine/homoserine lactone efflux protein
MTDAWTTLIPLAFVTAVLPVQVTITILMLREHGGRARAGAWIAGMSLVRLLQFAIFGVVLDRAMGESEAGASPVEGALLLSVAVLLFISAARKLLDEPDDDDAPPRWMAAVGSATPGRAALLGIAVVALSPKLWAFTLGAIGAIEEAQFAPAASWLVFVVWVAAAQATHLAAWLAVTVAPRQAQVVLARAAQALERTSRPLMIGIGLVLGTWFTLQSLAAFGFPGET